MQCNHLKYTFNNFLTQSCNLKDELIQFQPTVVQILLKLCFIDKLSFKQTLKFLKNPFWEDFDELTNQIAQNMLALTSGQCLQRLQGWFEQRERGGHSLCFIFLL